MKNFKKIAGVAVFAFAFAFAGAAFASVDVPPTLKVGSLGQEVMDLQAALGGLTVDGNFGPMTRAAVVAYQSTHGLVADGLVGPMTASSINGGTTGTGTGTTTGALCPNGMTLASNCTSGATAGGTLEGDAGSVDNYDLLSELNNEQVGEGEEEVEIVSFDVDVDAGSDLDFTSMKVWFENQDTGSSEDLDDFADSVQIWFEGELVGEADTNDFSADDTSGTETDNSTSDSIDEWEKTISLDGAVCDADETCTFTISITSNGSIDSVDHDSDDWDVKVTNVRFEDASGAVISEDPSFDETPFNFGTFADSSDLELKVSLSDDSPESQTLDVDDTDNTDGVELLAFEVEAEGSDMVVHDLPVLITVAQPSVTDDVDFIINTLYLTVDGTTYSETVSTSAGSAATITFDNIDVSIDENDTMEFVVTADFNDTQASEFVEGDTIKVELTAAIVNDIDADDAEGDSISDEDATGTALGDEMSLYNAGIMVSFVSASATSAVDDGSDDDTGTFTIKFTVEAFGGTVYIADTSAGTISTSIAETSLTDANGILYLVEDSGTATVDDLADLLTEEGDAEDSGANDNWMLTEGESSTFTLTVTQTNDTIEDDGLYRALLKSIGWNTTDSATVYNVYDFDLTDFKTDPISLN